MSYDIKMHLPQQIEALLLAKTEGKVKVFDSILNTVQTMLNNDDVTKTVVEYRGQRDTSIREIVLKCEQKKTETDIKGMNYLDILDHLENTETPRDKAIATELEQYMNTIETYVLGYVQQVEIVR